MSGPMFTFACAALVVTVALYLDGETYMIRKTLFGVFTIGGYTTFALYLYSHPSLKMGSAFTALLVLFCCVVLAWGYHLDAKGRSE